MHKTILFLLLRRFSMAVLLGLAVRARADMPHAVVGDPAAPAKLPAALLGAYEKGARDISITTGTYTLPAFGKPSIELVGWKDAVIHANNVTIVFEELKHRPLHLLQCERVTFEGAVLRFAKPAFTQGRIKAMGKDAKGIWLDWQVDAGYPTDLDPSTFCLDVVDQSTRLLRVGTGDIGCVSCETSGSGLFRMHGVNGRLGPATVNDWLFTRYGGAGSSVVHLDGCSHCTIAKTTLQNAGFGAFLETNGEGANVCRECRVMPAPKPAGATEDELAGCGADGFHSVGTRIGPTIDRCSWEGVLHDDCIAIHGSLQQVIRAEGNKLMLVQGNRGGFAVGEPVRISGSDGFYGEFTCVGLRNGREKAEYLELSLHRRAGRPPVTLSIKKNSGEAFALNDPVRISGKHGVYGDFTCKEIRTVTRDEGFLELTLDRPCEAPPDARASNPRRNGAGFKILNCTLGNCRSRGILVKADNGLIEGCTISGCGMSAISIGPEYFWAESDYSRHVTVRNNTLRCNEVSGEATGAVFVHGEGAIGNADITIAGNIFDRNYGQKAVYVEDTDGVAISGNRFIASPLPLANRPRTVLDFGATKHVSLQNNVVENPAAGDTLVNLGKGVEGVSGNDATGIAVAPAKSGSAPAGTHEATNPSVPVPKLTAPLWPAGKMPGHGASAPEQEQPSSGDGVVRLTNVSEPTLAVYPAIGGNHPAPVIIGYGILAINKEGTEIAAWLNSIGIDAAVLKYRVPGNRDGAFQDIQRAIRLVRANAQSWNMDAHRVGVMGFSAGGHLCARASTDFGRESYPRLDGPDALSCRPDFAVLVYPAYLNLQEKVAPELPISAGMPPILIVHTEDDRSFIPGSRLFNAALDSAKVPHRFELFATGGHGYGLRCQKEAKAWPERCRRWLEQNGFSSKPTASHPALLVASYTKHAAYLVSSDDRVLWKCEVPGACQDAWLLDNGNVLLSGGNQVKVVRPDCSVVWKYEAPAGQKVEIHNCQPLPNGGVLFGEGGTARLVELDGAGRFAREIKLPLTGGAHDQMRQVRKLLDGNYLVCAKGENNVRIFGPDGKQIREILGAEMKKQGVVWNALHSAIRLDNGNLLVGGGYDSSVAEVDAAGKVVWNLTKADVSEMGFTYAAGCLRLQDGTTVVAAYRSATPIFAVSPEKRVLWTCGNKEIGWPTHVKLISDCDLSAFLSATTKKVEAQSGAGIEREIADAVSEAGRAIAAAEFLTKTYPAQYDASFLNKLNASAKALDALRQAPPKDDAAMQSASEEIKRFREIRRAALFANPLLDFNSILFAKRQFLPGVERQGNHMCDQYFGFHAVPGGGVYILENAFRGEPKVRDLVSGATCCNGRFAGRKLTPGGFLSPELSYDAKTVLFCYTEAQKDLYEWNEHSTFHIFKINADGTGLTQLTDGPVNDLHPCFLPNGRIAFMSERRGGYGRCHGRPVPVYTLHSMRADGSDIVCLSWHESNEWYPSVTNDGMIVYTRWDYVDRGFNQAHHPWITTPDGCDPRALQGNYGKNQNARPLMENNVRAIPGSRKFVATAAAHHGQAYGSLVIVDPQVEDDDAMGPLKVLTPETGLPEATVSSRSGQEYATAWPLSEQFYLCVHDPMGSADRGVDNRFGIYLIDSFGNRELVYRDSEISCLSPIPFKARPVPPIVPPRCTEGAASADSLTMGALGTPAAVSSGSTGKPVSETAPVGLVNVYDSLLPLPKGVAIKALRIVALLSKTTPVADSPRMGYGHQKNGRAVLGTVPVEADGSAFFSVPVHRPIYFQALDENGLAVQSMRSDTYLHSGEMLTCQGCHNPVHRAPLNKLQTPAAFRRAPSRIVPEPEDSNPFSFVRLVQPVLDRNCVECHAKEKAIDLSKGDWEKNPNQWHTSYLRLQPFAFFYDNAVFTEPRTIPGKFGARASRLYQILSSEHHGLKLSKDDLHRVTLWLDCNSDYFGSFLNAARQARGEAIAPEE